MKKINILYWILTGLFAALMTFTAIPDIMMAPDAVAFMHDGLGYPLYLIPFIGVAKVLGAIAILIPGYPRIKEWAYAGLMFDITGAIYSIIAIGTPIGQWFPMFLFVTLGILSYVYYHKKLRLTNTPTT